MTIKEFNNFYFQRATSVDERAVKDLIFGVLEEYGLPVNEQDGPDVDLNDISANYPVDSRSLFWLVKLDDEVVGTVALAELNEKECELRKMYLSPKVRGQKLGDYIMKSILPIAKDLGYSTILLETDLVLKEAVKLYRKYGFVNYQNPHLCSRCDTAMKLELA